MKLLRIVLSGLVAGGGTSRCRKPRTENAPPVGGQSVDVGSVNLLVAVASDVVGPQRVDGDYHHVRRRNRRGEDGGSRGQQTGGQQEYTRPGENHRIAKLYPSKDASSLRVLRVDFAIFAVKVLKRK
jgi:hypothetical protein